MSNHFNIKIMIENDILLTWGAVAKKYKKGEFIFYEGEVPHFYYQLIDGKVKIFNINEDGKEYTQGDFTKGESFGEPPIFVDEPYPSTAVTTEDSIILKITKEKYIELLDEYPNLQKKIIKQFARRIYDKSVTAREIINNAPETRVLSFLNSYKKRYGYNNTEIKIPYTRQEIANFTGLRVETVIRTLNKMKNENKVKIVNRKLIY